MVVLSCGRTRPDSSVDTKRIRQRPSCFSAFSISFRRNLPLPRGLNPDVHVKLALARAEARHELRFRNEAVQNRALLKI